MGGTQFSCPNELLPCMVHRTSKIISGSCSTSWNLQGLKTYMTTIKKKKKPEKQSKRRVRFPPLITEFQPPGASGWQGYFLSEEFSPLQDLCLIILLAKEFLEFQEHFLAVLRWGSGQLPFWGVFCLASSGGVWFCSHWTHLSSPWWIPHCQYWFHKGSILTWYCRREFGRVSEPGDNQSKLINGISLRSSQRMNWGWTAVCLLLQRKCKITPHTICQPQVNGSEER